MPVVREPISRSVFCDEMGIDPQRFIGVEMPRRGGPVFLVTEAEMAQTSGVIPQLNQGGKKIGGRFAYTTTISLPAVKVPPTCVAAPVTGLTA